MPKHVGWVEEIDGGALVAEEGRLLASLCHSILVLPAKLGRIGSWLCLWHSPAYLIISSSSSSSSSPHPLFNEEDQKRDISSTSMYVAISKNILRHHRTSSGIGGLLRSHRLISHKLVRQKCPRNFRRSLSPVRQVPGGNVRFAVDGRDIPDLSIFRKKMALVHGRPV